MKDGRSGWLLGTLSNAVFFQIRLAKANVFRRALPVTRMGSAHAGPARGPEQSPPRVETRFGASEGQGKHNPAAGGVHRVGLAGHSVGPDSAAPAATCIQRIGTPQFHSGE